MSQNLDFNHSVPCIYLAFFNLYKINNAKEFGLKVSNWNFQEEDMFKTYNVDLFQVIGENAFLYVSGEITMMGMAGTNLVFASLKP